MKCTIIIFCLLSSIILVDSAKASLASDLKELEAASDDIGLRVIIRKNFKKKLTLSEWSLIRSILTRRPNVGFDVVRAWDNQISLKNTNLDKDAEKVDSALNKADNLMQEEQYEKAFIQYQTVAKYIKSSNGGRITRALSQLYLNVLHQMARALYSQRRFDDALEVYSWIPPVYSQIRQVMFEKMWTAFRANKVDIALGAIASQQSEFFSRYLDPESYLIKIYLLKKLCREDELKLTVRSIQQYLKDLRSEKFTYMDWARADLSRMSLAKLLEESDLNPKLKTNIVSDSERDIEKRKIQNYLQRRFKVHKPRLEKQLERVLGYAALALTQDQKLIGKVKTLPESSVLESQGYELWPAKTAEEWTDEIGSHIFIGETNCQ